MRVFSYSGPRRKDTTRKALGESKHKRQKATNGRRAERYAMQDCQARAGADGGEASDSVAPGLGTYTDKWDLKNANKSARTGEYKTEQEKLTLTTKLFRLSNALRAIEKQTLELVQCHLRVSNAYFILS